MPVQARRQEIGEREQTARSLAEREESTRQIFQSVSDAIFLSDMEDLIVPIGVPITILVLLAVAACVVSMTFSGGLKYPKVQIYTLDQKWTHKPLLFSATDIAPMSAERHAESDDVDGGTASGKW